VRVEPVEVRFERLQEIIDGARLVVALAREDPVRLPDLGKEVLSRDVAAADRDQAFVEGDRGAQLLRADLRPRERRREHGHDRACALDSGLDLGVPVGALRNVLEVDPDVLAPLLEGGREPAREVAVRRE
jgi:hypothetical protein